MIRHLSCFPLSLVNLERQEISISNEQLCLATIYSATGMKPLWVTVDGPGEAAATLLDYLKNSGEEGLDPRDYHIEEIAQIWDSRDPDNLALLDTTLTLSLIKYVHDITHGRIAPYKRDPELFAGAGDPHFRPVLVVEQALNAPDLGAYLASLPPSHIHYKRLKEALRYYRELALENDWPTVAAGRTIHPGDSDERMSSIRLRLAREKLLAEPLDDGPVYDSRTVDAIRRFQKKYGLEIDGIIGRNTLAALNTSPDDIIGKIILNMARWRWQEHELGDRYIIVNIASYDLRYFEEDQEVISMAVIVGKLQHQTPVFSDRVRYVDFNPFWNIPPSIARNEELQELRKDPYYLVNRHVRLFSDWQEDAVELDSTKIDWNSVTPRQMNRYKLRQDPGPWNALGQVKLAFPNHNNVYIHGTPAQELFERTTRSFSHGCIRASQPLLLASYALGKQEWPFERVKEVVNKGDRKVIKLPSPLPVHITYQTAWVDKDGEIRFNIDNYERDSKLMEILLQRNSTSLVKNEFR